MAYFTKEFVNFFLELEKNNKKEWFHTNKKTYEAYVKKPMVAFVTDVIQEMKKSDREIDIDPKKCIGRINRDIRFSKDKTPYNIRLFAHITKGPKSDPLPGVAFRFGGRDSGIMGGFYNPSKSRLSQIREQISAAPKTFNSLYSAKAFMETFGSIQGEAHKRIPPEFRTAYEEEPLIALKQFYYVREYGPEIALRDDLLSFVLHHWEVARPLNNFLAQ
ncbi:MAG: DUF2461 domain-containing protein [Flavobacteriaceae bacterium]